MCNFQKSLLNLPFNWCSSKGISGTMLQIYCGDFRDHHFGGGDIIKLLSRKPEAVVEKCLHSCEATSCTFLTCNQKKVTYSCLPPH